MEKLEKEYDYYYNIKFDVDSVYKMQKENWLGNDNNKDNNPCTNGICMWGTQRNKTSNHDGKIIFIGKIVL